MMSSTRMRAGAALHFISAFLVLWAGFWAHAAMATEVLPSEAAMSCEIQGQQRQLSVSIAGTRAHYRYGVAGQKPELALSSPLADLDYRRNYGPASTIGEIVTFHNGDTAYRVESGFRGGVQPDPTTLQPFGLLTVSRAGKTLATLRCRPETIQRVPDRFLAAMREIGRERDSDGEVFPNYQIQYPASAAQSPACEEDFNVDTCWSRAVAVARSGDQAGALAHFDMSCDAGFNINGCYEAGKLYLHNRQLRNYSRALTRLTTACDSRDPGFGPYGCKYLGWMYLTGTGTPRDLDKAWSNLARACFLHNDVNMIDGEGCHFFARTVNEARAAMPAQYKDAEFLAYLALAQGCTDDAKTVCDEAQALYRQGAGQRAHWVKRCEATARTSQRFTACADMVRVEERLEDREDTRSALKSMFLTALAALR